MEEIRDDNQLANFEHLKYSSRALLTPLLSQMFVCKEKRNTSLNPLQYTCIS